MPTACKVVSLARLRDEQARDERDEGDRVLQSPACSQRPWCCLAHPVRPTETASSGTATWWPHTLPSFGEVRLDAPERVEHGSSFASVGAEHDLDTACHGLQPGSKTSCFGGEQETLRSPIVGIRLDLHHPPPLEPRHDRRHRRACDPERIGDLRNSLRISLIEREEDRADAWLDVTQEPVALELRPQELLQPNRDSRDRHAHAAVDILRRDVGHGTQCASNACRTASMPDSERSIVCKVASGNSIVRAEVIAS